LSKAQYDNILFLVEDNIAFVTLNRPKALNALNTQTLKEIVSALESSSCFVAIITGSERAFSAGADIKQMAAASPIDQLQDERELLWKKFNLLPMPIIAAVNGFCLGGGHELAMSCDIVIAGDNAKFGQPEINIGTIPGAGGTQRLTKAVGKSKAMELCLTGELFSAIDAKEWKLVSKVVPYQTTLTESIELAKKIAAKSPLASRLIKENINKSFETHLQEGLSFERRNFYLTFASKDQKEGMNAFLEKRAPDYQGN
jgi:enoyl-CoA hydratase